MTLQIQSSADGRVWDSESRCYYHPYLHEGRVFSGKEQLEIKRQYRKLLREKEINKALAEEMEALEKREGCPKTWLTRIVSDLALGGDERLAKKLFDVFRHRGFGDSWLGKGQDIKRENAGSCYGL